MVPPAGDRSSSDSSTSGTRAAAASRSSMPVILAILAVAAVGLVCVIGILIALLMPAIQGSREAARREESEANLKKLGLALQNYHEAGRSQCRNHLKQIGLAMHNYHDVYKSFPPAVVAGSDGRPMHSWRVLILPFLNEQELYKTYNLGEPWDGPNNSLLANRMPAAYRCPSAPDQTSVTTSYMAVTGPGAIFDGAQASGFKDITDGASQTLLLVETTRPAVNWMQPVDLDFQTMAFAVDDPAGADISSHHHQGANILMADGSVRFISLGVDPQALRALFTRAGGEVMDDF